LTAALRAALASPHSATLRRAAWLLVAALLCGGALVAFASWRLSDAAAAREAESLAVQPVRQQAQALRALGPARGPRAARVLALRRAGVTQPTRRVDWAERVTATVVSLQPLGYAIEVGAERARPLPAALQSLLDAQGVGPATLQQTDLSLKVQGLHEQELVALMVAARAASMGLVRLESCKIERRADGIGLDSDCRLRRLALRFDAGQATEATP
jgi:hypothetical protein